VKKVEMIPTISRRNVRFKIKSNQCAHAQLSYHQLTSTISAWKFP